MKKAIIVDIDGTLANNKHRQHFVNGVKRDWDSFFNAMDKDEVNEWCDNLLFFVEHYNGYSEPTKKSPERERIRIILVSGRPEKYREKTERWLQSKGIKFDEMFLRPDGDKRPSPSIKKMIYYKYIKDKYDVMFVIDDRNPDVGMWRSQGLVCLHCDWNPFVVEANLKVKRKKLISKRLFRELALMIMESKEDERLYSIRMSSLEEVWEAVGKPGGESEAGPNYLDFTKE